VYCRSSSIRDNMALVPTSTTVAEGNREQIRAGRDYFAFVPIDGSPGRTVIFAIWIKNWKPYL
jgi:hypothetical protein